MQIGMVGAGGDVDAREGIQQLGVGKKQRGVQLTWTGNVACIFWETVAKDQWAMVKAPNVVIAPAGAI